jgi:hypothetical protein
LEAATSCRSKNEAASSSVSNGNAVDIGKGRAGGLEKVEWRSRVGLLVAEIKRGRIHS